MLTPRSRRPRTVPPPVPSPISVRRLQPPRFRAWSLFPVLFPLEMVDHLEIRLRENKRSSAALPKFYRHPSEASLKERNPPPPPPKKKATLTDAEKYPERSVANSFAVKAACGSSISICVPAALARSWTLHSASRRMNQATAESMVVPTVLRTRVGC